MFYSFDPSGGAADIVMCAMLRIESDQRLKALGFRQVLQVHDEIILEVRIISSISDDSKISF